MPKMRGISLVLLPSICLFLLAQFGFFTFVLAADEKNSQSGVAKTTDISSAMDLFNHKHYAEAAVIFEKIMSTSTPNARLCYYTAVADLESGKKLKAVQLFNYILKNFPNTQESAFAQVALDKLSANSKTSTGVASKRAGKETNAAPSATGGAKTASKADSDDDDDDDDAPSAAKTTAKPDDKNKAGLASGTGSVYPFTAADIARDGANGIDQMLYPNCWFEASMAALAELPRGQRLIASMIKTRGPGYVVRFPGDGVEYIVTREDLKKNRIKNRALWASLIECAQIRKFPNNQGAGGAYGDQSRLEVGLGSITGCRAEIIYPASVSLQELSSFIDGAIRSKNPVIGGTHQINNLPVILVPTHAYTFIGFDPARNMVTLRNPHGKNSAFYVLPDDPRHEQFQQLENGIIKISLENVQRYFYSIARSFI